MPCFHPITAYRARSGRSETGAWPLTFNPKDGYLDKMVKLPCGQCIGCRLEKSRQWAIRCVHEASMHDENCFATLTYNDANVKESLEKADYQKFMKRLREKFPDKKIKYFHCGEYGENFDRAHHHAILFGLEFEDKELIYKKGEVETYTSKTLEKIWGQGYVTIGDVTWESAAYVARYCTKKVTGDKAKEYYGDKTPEYVTMSLKPAIAKEWYKKFKTDLYNDDTCVVRDGFICKPAKYYDKLYDIDNKYHMELIKSRRLRAAANNPENETDRLIEKEKCQQLRFKKLKRGFETFIDTGIIDTNDKYIKNNDTMPENHEKVTKKNLKNARIDVRSCTQRRTATARTRSEASAKDFTRSQIKFGWQKAFEEAERNLSLAQRILKREEILEQINNL